MTKKTKIPKKIMGYKIPKAIRKSPILRSLLASKTGRGILASALTAGAGAAASVLLEERKEIAGAAKTGTKKGANALGLVGEAMAEAVNTAMAALREGTHDALPKKVRKAQDRRPQSGAAVH